MKLGGLQRAYVVGSFDYKKTIATQQTRASVLALAASIQPPQKSMNVAVIGGGFAGISCAATLLKLGHSVELFEQKDRLIPIQVRCFDRYIHPTLFDWPDCDIDANFRMSGINWSPGFADAVSRQTIESFDAIKSKHAMRYRPHFSMTIEDIEETPEKKYTLLTDRRFTFSGFDAVFFTVGFGFESPVMIGDRIRRYWATSNLDHIHGTKQSPVKVLVSGAGDGGLLSVLNCALKNYDHAILHELAPKIFSKRTKRRIAEIEKEIQNGIAGGEEVSVIAKYDEAFRSRIDGWKKHFEPLVSEEVNVVFNSVDRGVFSPGSAALNRILVYLLLRMDLIDFVGLPLKPDIVSEEVDADHVDHIVDWPGRGQTRYRHIIVRHGVSRKFFENSFPTLEAAISPIKGLSPQLALERAIPDDILEILREL